MYRSAHSSDLTVSAFVVHYLLTYLLTYLLHGAESILRS